MIHSAVLLCDRLGIIICSWDIDKDDFGDWFAEFRTNDPMEVLLFCLCYDAGSVVVVDLGDKWAVSAYGTPGGVEFVSVK
jgi:hypothetical protein